MSKEINLYQHPDVSDENSIEPSKTNDENKSTKPIKQQIKRIIEALLFASNEPIPFSKILEVTESSFGCGTKLLRELLQELQHDYIVEQRAFRLEEIANGYMIRTCGEYAPYIHLMRHGKRAEKLSRASTEVLAIIAYKQPITRAQIDAIRGVDSSGTLYNLVQRKLVAVTGRLQTPGCPALYGTTQEFLHHFGLKTMAELPPYQ